MLGGRYALTVMSRYVSERGGKLTDHRERDRLLYWYVQSFLWGWYASSTESTMNQDLHAIESLDGDLDRLIGAIPPRIDHPKRPMQITQNGACRSGRCRCALDNRRAERQDDAGGSVKRLRERLRRLYLLFYLPLYGSGT